MKKLFAFIAATFAAMTISAEVMTCAAAADLALNGEPGDAQYTAQGYVTEIAFALKDGSMSFWMADAVDGGKVIEAYKCVVANEADAPAVGDKVNVTGKLVKYTPKSGDPIAEFAAGCTFEMIERAPVVALDTLSVAEAIATTMALDSAATSEKEYVVMGYVVDAQDFSWGSLQQLFFMADDAENTGNQVFEAYFCTAKKDGEAIPVLNGDKIYLKGKLTKYWDKNAATPAFLPEVKNGEAEFISMVEGDRSKPEAENISVAAALEIGKDVASGSTSEEVYNIVGYVTAMAGKNADGGWAQFGNQMFWIADVMDTTLHSNEAGAFEVYQGVAPSEVKVGYKISVYTKVKNYNGLLESETKAPVTIIEGARIDTITAGDAIAIALALEDNKTTEETYVVQGYVKKIKEAYNAQFGNVTFYLADAMDSQEDVNVYRGKISAEEGAALAEGDFVAVVGKLTNNYYNNKNSARMNESEVFVRWKTAIENVLMNNPKINKVIVDGVVYIVREGKMYNMQGVQVR